MTSACFCYPTRYKDNGQQNTQNLAAMTTIGKRSYYFVVGGVLRQAGWIGSKIYFTSTSHLYFWADVHGENQ